MPTTLTCCAVTFAAWICSASSPAAVSEDAMSENNDLLGRTLPELRRMRDQLSDQLWMEDNQHKLFAYPSRRAELRAKLARVKQQIRQRTLRYQHENS